MSAVPAKIVLEDGTEWLGKSFGADRHTNGEIVFQTGMVGYVESLTDPSYEGQLLVLTYPLVGNYGVPSDERDQMGLHKFFERDRIYAGGLIVSHVSPDYSHWNAKESLSAWLRRENIVGVTDIDTRALTRHIRERGCMLAKIVVGSNAPNDSIAFEDPNKSNLVARVSVKSAVTYNAGGSPRIVCVDCGMKNNQIRMLVQRGCRVTVIPFDTPIVPYLKDHDGVFISNGPGDPSMCAQTIQNIRDVLKVEPPVPLFGICLGNQLLALAAGAKTYKLSYGNRGHNIPAIDLRTGRCYITTQNHGFAVDTKTLPSDWSALFTNANDYTNEGIMHKTKPFFAAQFHPEAAAGPHDTAFLFDDFIRSIQTKSLPPPPEHTEIEKVVVSVPHNLRKVVVLGSGGLTIGQAGEFDYSGSQCLKALKEEGIYSVLINPNIATVQTSKGLAGKVYFVPITPHFVTQVLEQERPDGILLNFGGQTALNCGVKLWESGVFQRLGVKVLGTPVETIIKTEDRQLFAAELLKINEPIAKSRACVSVDEAVAAANEIGYPVIARAAFTLGGLGSGFADNDAELIKLCHVAFAASPQVLVERSMRGWKEVEYEVVRDAYDNCITVCNMENFDPLGVHTGDSVVVAPSQTLSDEEYQMLRTCAIKVVRHLGVIGECNIQYALNPKSLEYCIIEVNARLSRSSALASKATGYPLAFVAAKLSIGMQLPLIRNSVTRVTSACFEPSLDYVVVKLPRWDLTKFGPRVSRHISSAMKSVGEVMAIGRTFEEAIQKGIRMVTDGKALGFDSGGRKPNDRELSHPTDQRMYFIAAALEQGQSVEHVHSLTFIDRWFLNRLKQIVDLKTQLSNYSLKTMPTPLLGEAKSLGFSDHQIATVVEATAASVRTWREEHGILPSIKQIDTVAAEFPAKTNYLYMTYTSVVTHDVVPATNAVLVIGSGAYRIGSSVEFDWCAVNCIRTLQELGRTSVMLNCNPETVSTDYDECDRLYFDEQSLERVLDIYRIEQAEGVVVSVGGQIPNNLAIPLFRNNVKVLGTSPEMIDRAENRYKFSRLLDQLDNVDQPKWKEATSLDDAKRFCDAVSYPVLVRPSYVLSGAAMNVAYSHKDLQQMLTEAATVSSDFPVVVSKFIDGAKEIEVDAVAKDGVVVIGVVSEHVENAGVHSGDATLVLPAQDLSQETLERVLDSAQKIIKSLQVTGPVNIQFLAKDNDVKVIECNLRASRSFPFDSKTVDRDFIAIATRVMLGYDSGYRGEVFVGARGTLGRVGVKVAQFSFPRLAGADPVLGVEMASTGEVACFAATREEAYLKALLATGFSIPKQTILLAIGSYKDKMDFLSSSKRLQQLGYTLLGTQGTSEFLSEHGVKITPVSWMEEEEVEAGDEADEGRKHQISALLRAHSIDLLINTPSQVRVYRSASVGYQMRRMAVDFGVPLIVNIKCAKLFVNALNNMAHRAGDDKVTLPPPMPTVSRSDFVSSNHTVILDGFIDVAALRSADWKNPDAISDTTRSAIKQGITLAGVMPPSTAVDSPTLRGVIDYATKSSHTDFAIWLPATHTNQTSLTKTLTDMSLGLYALSDAPTDCDAWQQHIDNQPHGVPIVVSAGEGVWNEVVLLCHLASRPVHVANVRTFSQLALIRTCKAQGVHVTCDISPHHLFVCREDVAVDSPLIPELVSAKDQSALWENLRIIDCFASAPAPFGLHDILPLLLDAVRVNRLTLECLVDLLHDKPRTIFDLPKQSGTYVEVDLDEKWDGIPVLKQFGIERKGHGQVRRVVLHDHLVSVEGKVIEKILPTHVVRGARRHVEFNDRSRVSAVSSDLSSPILSAAALPSKTRAAKSTSFSPALSPSKPPPSSSNATSIANAGVGSGIVSAAGKGVLSSLQSPALGPTEPLSWFKNKSILSAGQFTKGHNGTLDRVLQVARDMHTSMRHGTAPALLQGKIVGCLFYESSTRTYTSFECATKRLGGQFLSMDTKNVLVKGETVEDTVRMLDGYSDVIVMRHDTAGSVASVARHCKQSIINAGDGSGEHPTQAIQDIYTIIEERGTVNGLTITLIGDLKTSRAAHSLARLLGLYDVRLNYVSPPHLSMPAEIVAALNSRGIEQNVFTDLDRVLPETDVLYITRIGNSGLSEQEAKNYKVTLDTLARARPSAIILHPLPRHSEISPEVDGDPRAAYFRQAEYGVYVRMALLALVLGRI